MIKMLTILMEKVNNMEEQICNINKEMKMLRNDKKEMLRNKNTKINKDHLYGLINWLEHSQRNNQWIWRPVNRKSPNYNAKIQRMKTYKKTIYKNYEIIARGVVYI